jgi:hypothetical protein
MLERGIMGSVTEIIFRAQKITGNIFSGSNLKQRSDELREDLLCFTSMIPKG